ncbi:MAG TPA: hypothetical protein VIS95_02770 [Solirubrobacterales bacterium]
MPGDEEQADDFYWDGAAARVLHPVRVEIIEAMRWIDRPLSAIDLVYVFEGKQLGLWIEHHLRCLVKLRIAVEENDGQGTGDPTTQPLYRLNRPGT